MSALRNLIGKVRELYRQFWADDQQTMIEDLRHERDQLRSYIAKLQLRDSFLSSEIRRHEAKRFLGVGS